ncbi:MAG: phage tail protein [Lachnospiraceae bacterium]|nr:phage tail protein [Lachnospiraceae bacterium]
MGKDSITAVKPKVGGALYVAPTTATLPTDFSTALDSAFKSLGYISEDGVKNNNGSTSEELRAWGGEVVHATEKEYKDNYFFTLIEFLNLEVLSIAFGEGNISDIKDGGVTVGHKLQHNNHTHDTMAWVFEMVLEGDRVMRKVIPCAKVTELGEINFKDSEPVKLDVSLSAFLDSAGNSSYDYISEPLQ